MEKEKLFKLLETENLQHKKLHDIVIKAIHEKKYIISNLMTLKPLFDIQKMQIELMEDIKTVIDKPVVS